MTCAYSDCRYGNLVGLKKGDSHNKSSSNHICEVCRLLNRDMWATWSRDVQYES